MPPKVTAGLARSRVSGYKRSPAPPASKTPRVSLILMISEYEFPRWDPRALVCWRADRKSTRLNSSHLVISYAVFCLKTKKVEDGVGIQFGAHGTEAAGQPPQRLD